MYACAYFISKCWSSFYLGFFCAVCLGQAGQKLETRSGWDLCGTEWSEKDVGVTFSGRCGPGKKRAGKAPTGHKGIKGGGGKRKGEGQENSKQKKQK